MQGHWARVNTPLRETTPRERLLVRAVVAFVGIAVIATIVVAIATSGNGTSGKPLGTGCIRIEAPSTMGASVSDICGSRNISSFCRSAAANSPPLNATALPKCRNAGY